MRLLIKGFFCFSLLLICSYAKASQCLDAAKKVAVVPHFFPPMRASWETADEIIFDIITRQVKDGVEMERQLASLEVLSNIKIDPETVKGDGTYAIANIANCLLTLMYKTRDKARAIAAASTLVSFNNNNPKVIKRYKAVVSRWLETMRLSPQDFHPEVIVILKKGFT
jgi:hypothetical protein